MPARKFEDDDLRALVAEGLHQMEIARRLRVSPQAVRSRLDRLGIDARGGCGGRRRTYPISAAQLRAMAAEGLTMTEAAARLGSSTSRVSQLVKSLGVDWPTGLDAIQSRRAGLVAALRDGAPLEHLMNCFGFTDVSAARIVADAGWSVIQGRVWSPPELARLARRLDFAALADHVGCGTSGMAANGLRRVLRRHGIPIPQGSPRTTPPSPRQAVRAAPKKAPEDAGISGPEVVAHPFWTPEREAMLARLASYDDINAYAARIRRPYQDVLARWHRVRAGA